MKRTCQVLPVLLITAAACGTSAPATTATVQLQPLPGWDGSAEVLVHSPTGTLVSRTPVTDTLDVAIDDNDTVTVVVTSDGTTTLESSFGVQRGDTIAVPVASSGSDATIEVAVTVPTVTGATAWTVGTPDSASFASDPSEIMVEVAAGATTTPILATATDDTGALAMFGETAAAIAGGGSSATVGLRDAVDFRAVPVVAINAPADIASDNIFVGGEVYLGDDALVLAQVGSDTIMPTSFGDRLGVVAGAFGSAGTVYVGSILADAPNDTVSIDLSAPALPQVSQLAIGATGPSWTLAGGDAYAYVSAGLTASTDDSFEWTITAPPGTSALALPQMPSDIAVPAFDTLGVGVTQISSYRGYGDALDAPRSLPAGTTFEARFVSIVPASSDARVRRGHGFCLTPVTFHAWVQ